MKWYISQGLSNESNMENKHKCSSFDSFLEAEGLLDHSKAVAINHAQILQRRGTTNEYFDENIRVLLALKNHASDTDLLLDIPFHLSSIDPLTIAFHNKRSVPQNLGLIYLNLQRELHNLNRMLVILYATAHYLKKARISDAQNSNYIDQHLIISEYSRVLREFISVLRFCIDQCIILLNIPNVDCIGTFLKKIPPEFDSRFLFAINVTSNYLKHHSLQLEAPATFLPTNKAGIYVLLDKSDRNKKEIAFLKNNFTNREYSEQNGIFSFWVECEFFVKGFNKFFETFSSLVSTSPTTHSTPSQVTQE